MRLIGMLPHNCSCRQIDLKLMPLIMNDVVRPSDHQPAHHSHVDETRQWQEGRCLIFDDTVQHEAWNNSDLPRGVLLLDFCGRASAGRSRITSRRKCRSTPRICSKRRSRGRRVST